MPDPGPQPSATSAEHPAEHPGDHPRITAFRRLLAARGCTGEVAVLPESVHTAKLAAQAQGCPVGAIVNSLVFAVPAEEPTEPTGATGGGRDAEAATPVLLLVSGAHRVATDAVATRLGVTRLERADSDFVRTHTGQVIGGVSPIGHPAPVPTYLDPDLRQHPVLWAAAGHPAAVFSTDYDELLRLTGATELDMTAS